MNFLKNVCFIYLFFTFFNNYGVEHQEDLLPVYTLLDGTIVNQDPQEVLKKLKKIYYNEMYSDDILNNLYEFCKNPCLGAMYSTIDQETYAIFEKYGFIKKTDYLNSLYVDKEYLKIIENCIIINKHCFCNWATLIDPITGEELEIDQDPGCSRYDFRDINAGCVIL